MVKSEYIDEVTNACFLDYYLSANEGCRSNWKLRMQPVHESNPSYREAADKYIIDSAILRPEIDNSDALDEAKRLEADAVLLADYLPFHLYNEDKLNREAKRKIQHLRDSFDSNYEASIHSIKKGMKIANEHDFSGKIIIPLQPPHIDFWKEVGKPDVVAIGGVKDEPAKVKVNAAKKVRRAVGDDTYVHGLGYGATEEIVQAVRENPKLLDSIDSQTSMSSALNNHEYWNGDDVTTATACHLEGYLVEKCRRMSRLTKSPMETDKKRNGLFDY